jgi:hypothetical protein
MNVKRECRTGDLAPAGSQKHDHPGNLKEEKYSRIPDCAKSAQQIDNMAGGWKQNRDKKAVGDGQQAHDLVNADLAVTAIVGS